MPRTSGPGARPRTLGLVALVVLLLVGAYAIGTAVVSSRNLPPPAAPVILGGTSDSPRPTKPPKPAGSQKPKAPAPKVRTNAPAPPVVKPTPRKVDRVVVGDRDDDDDRDDRDGRDDRDDDDDEADDD